MNLNKSGKKVIPAILMFLPIFAFAEQTLSLQNPLGTQTFEELIAAIINWLLVITLPIIVLLILYAAFQFVVSGVSPEQRKNAVNVVKYAMIGYAVMLLAKVLVEVVSGVFD
jgi:heme/copper-type cytochrome/quinol oxidase subunit 2